MIDRPAIGLLFDEEGAAIADGCQHGREVAGREDDVVAAQELAVEVPLGLGN